MYTDKSYYNKKLEEIKYAKQKFNFDNINRGRINNEY